MPSKECRTVQRIIRLQRSGETVDALSVHKAEQHINRCAACREKAYRQGFALLLQQALGRKAPEPSAHFHARLRTRLAAADRGEPGMIQAALMQAGLKLVPVLTALMIVIAGASGLMWRLTEETKRAELGEYVFFSNARLTNELLVSEIIMYEDRP